MENKQTAIEWFVHQLSLRDDVTLFSKEIRIAKEMEKQQIKDAWNDGNLLGRNGWVQEEYSTADGYYNINYKKP